jgi:hypothetical protein
VFVFTDHDTPVLGACLSTRGNLQHPELSMMEIRVVTNPYFFVAEPFLPFLQSYDIGDEFNFGC